MPEASCHCGAVRLEVTALPDELNECLCSICRSYGVRWAYYPVTSVCVTAAALDGYEWGPRTVRFHRCPTCGCVTHWSSNDPAGDEVGVNARLFDPALIAGVPVHPSLGPDD